MSKRFSSITTLAVKRAASGEITNSKRGTYNRAISFYGLSNHALNKTGAELKEAWKSASSITRDIKA